jgi:hypothetical protein
VGVAETVMPEVDGRRHGGGWVVGGGAMESVEVAGAIEPSDLRFGLVVLHRLTKRIKFHTNKIVTGELTNRN